MRLVIILVLQCAIKISAIIKSGSWNKAVIEVDDFQDLGISIDTSDWRVAARFCNKMQNCRLFCDVLGVYTFSLQDITPEYYPRSVASAKYDCWTHDQCE